MTFPIPDAAEVDAEVERIARNLAGPDADRRVAIRWEPRCDRHGRRAPGNTVQPCEYGPRWRLYVGKAEELIGEKKAMEKCDG